MVIDVRPLQLLKAPPSIFVTLSGIIVLEHPAINLLVFVSIIALQLLRESYFALFFSYNNRSKATASTESTMSDRHDTLRYSNGCKTTAIIES